MAQIVDSEGVLITTNQLEIEAAQWDGAFSYPPHYYSPSQSEDDDSDQEGERIEASAFVEAVLKAEVGRVYVQSPDDAPDDANVQQGDQGGYYYEPSDDTNLDTSIDTVFEDFDIDSPGEIPLGTEVQIDESGMTRSAFVTDVTSGGIELHNGQTIDPSEIEGMNPSSGPEAGGTDSLPEVSPDNLSIGDVVRTESGNVGEVNSVIEASGEVTAVSLTGPDSIPSEFAPEEISGVYSADALVEETSAPDSLGDVEVGDTLEYNPPFREATEATVEEVDEEYDEVRLDVDGEPRYVFEEDFGSSVFYNEDTERSPTERLAALTDQEPDEVVDLYQHEGSASGISASNMTVETYGSQEVFVTDTDVSDDDPGSGETREDADRALAAYHLSSLLGGRVPAHNLRVEDDDSARMEVMGVGEGDVRQLGSSIPENRSEAAQSAEREDFVKQAAIQYLAGNSDAHPDNVRLGQNGEVYMTDLDHSGGDFTESPFYRNRAIDFFRETGEKLGFSDGLGDDIRDKSEELAEEIHDTEEFEETLDAIRETRQDSENPAQPDEDLAQYEYEENIRSNVNAFVEGDGY